MEFQKELLAEISLALFTSGHTVAVAESVTSGFLQFSFSQMKNASLFYKGGMTVYTLDEKIKLLHQNPAETQACNGVSQHIAESMAKEIAGLYGSDWGISVTGYASPVRNSGFKIYCWFSFSFKNEIRLSQILELHPKTKSLNAQLYFGEYILNCFKTLLETK